MIYKVMYSNHNYVSKYIGFMGTISSDLFKRKRIEVSTCFVACIYVTGLGKTGHFARKMKILFLAYPKSTLYYLYKNALLLAVT